jgi:VWFA-related protein
VGRDGALRRDHPGDRHRRPPGRAAGDSRLQRRRRPVEPFERRVEGSDATVYVIGQGRAAERTALQKVLQRFADVSGGRAFFTHDLERLDKAFQEIIEDLSHQYLLSYAPPSAAPGVWRKIKVSVSGDYRVRARQGYRLVKHD